VPAASLASWTREAGGHRPFPLRGGADRSAATALANDGKAVGISVTETCYGREYGTCRCATERSSSPKSRGGTPSGVARLKFAGDPAGRGGVSNHQVRLTACCLPSCLEGKLLTPRTRKRRENESACRDNRRIDVAHQPTNSGNPALRFCESSRTRLANCFQASENLHDTYVSIPLSEIRVRSVKCCRLPSLHRTGRKN
jgi:hypothetical protein